MATVIDSLLVTLGLDSSQFDAAQKRAVENLRKFDDAADKSSKQAQKGAKDLGEAFDKVKNGLYALGAVALGATGFTEFVTRMVGGNAELGRTAQLLGMSARELDAWGATAKTVGGTAEGFQQSMQNIVGSLAKFRLGKGGEDVVIALAQLGVQARNGTVDIYELAAGLQRMRDARGIQAALTMAQQLGLDQGTFQMLMTNMGQLKATHDKMFANSGVTDANIKAAQRLQDAWAGLAQSASGAAQKIFGDLAPSLEKATDLIRQLGDWAAKNQDVVSAFFIVAGAAAGVLLVPMLPMIGMVLAITAAIVGATAAVTYLYREWEKWTSGGKSSLGGLFAFFRDTWKLIVALFTGNGDQIRAAWDKVWDDARGIFDDFVKWMNEAGPRIADAIKGAFSHAFDWVKGRAYAVWDAIRGNHAEHNPGADSAAADGDAPDSAGSSAAASGGAPAPGGGGSAGGARMPRGMRNNNPGNIEDGPFARAHGATGTDGRFAIFPTMEAGQAAMDDLLKSYKSKGIDTIAGIVQRYAPSSENDTAAYIAAVSKQTGIGAGQHLTDDQYASIRDAMATHENGSAYSRMVGAGMNGARTQQAANTTVETNIGSINVHTPATDADGIARGMKTALANNSLISSGLQGTT